MDSSGIRMKGATATAGYLRGHFVRERREGPLLEEYQWYLPRKQPNLNSPEKIDQVVSGIPGKLSSNALNGDIPYCEQLSSINARQPYP